MWKQTDNLLLLKNVCRYWTVYAWIEGYLDNVRISLHKNDLKFELLGIIWNGIGQMLIVYL